MARETVILRQSRGVSAVTADSSVTLKRQGVLIGTFCTITGLIAIGMVAFIGVSSFTAFNPPEWARVGSLALLAISLAASVLLGMLGWRNAGRTLAVAGLSLSAMAVAAFAVMILVGE